MFFLVLNPRYVFAFKTESRSSCCWDLGNQWQNSAIAAYNCQHFYPTSNKSILPSKGQTVVRDKHLIFRKSAGMAMISLVRTSEPTENVCLEQPQVKVIWEGNNFGFGTLYITERFVISCPKKGFFETCTSIPICLLVLSSGSRILARMVSHCLTHRLVCTVFRLRIIIIRIRACSWLST